VFPGSQIGSGDKWTQARYISATEYLSYEGGKFSKSKGVGVFGDSAKNTGIDADIWRFFLLSRRPESGTDTAFKWQEFIDVNNNELLKNLGNLVNRVVKFCHAKMGAVVPHYTAMEDIQPEVNSLLASYIAHFEATRMRLALTVVLQISGVGNKFLQDNKFDNQLLAENPKRCANIVGTALSLIHLLANLLSPFMPKTAESIFEQLGVEPVAKVPDTWAANTLVEGRALGEPRPLFSKIPAGKLEEWQEKFSGDVGKQKRLEAEQAAEKQAAKKAAEKAKKDKKKAEKKKAAEEAKKAAEANMASLSLK
jgi:methionyl-tRNA synthetase